MSVTEPSAPPAAPHLRRQGSATQLVVDGAPFLIIGGELHNSTSSDLAALHPVGRMGEVSDVVDAVLYLDDANFVTGEILHVDGGQIAGS